VREDIQLLLALLRATNSASDDTLEDMWSDALKRLFRLVFFCLEPAETCASLAEDILYPCLSTIAKVLQLFTPFDKSIAPTPSKKKENEQDSDEEEDHSAVKLQKVFS
jgi:hypothetical protein